MKKSLVGIVGALAASLANAQYNGPAVETCRAYAKKEMAREGTSAKDVIFVRDDELSLERYTKKVGDQFVSSILRGNGAVVLDSAPSAELSFICLLANDKRAVFFEWLPRRNPSPLAQCTRDEKQRANPRPCLETLLQVAEGDLMQSYAMRFQDARERDHAGGSETYANTFRKANDQWKEYRDAECARRRDLVPQGVKVEDHELACMVELTRRRALDMR